MDGKLKTDQITGVRNSEHITTILNCVADGIFTVDQEKRITFFNKAAEQITGYPAAEAVGKLCREVFKSSLCGEKCTLQEVELTGGSIINRAVRILDRFGRSVLVSVSAASLRNGDGKLIGGVETFRDLSAEEVLRREIEK